MAKKETTIVRIDKGLRQIIKMRAAQQQMTMEDYLNMVLRASFKQESRHKITTIPTSEMEIIDTPFNYSKK